MKIIVLQVKINRNFQIVQNSEQFSKFAVAWRGLKSRSPDGSNSKWKSSSQPISAQIRHVSEYYKQIIAGGIFHGALDGNFAQFQRKKIYFR